MLTAKRLDGFRRSFLAKGDAGWVPRRKVKNGEEDEHDAQDNGDQHENSADSVLQHGSITFFLEFCRKNKKIS